MEAARDERTFEAVMVLTVRARDEEEARQRAVAFERIRERFAENAELGGPVDGSLDHIPGLAWLHVGLTHETLMGIRGIDDDDLGTMIYEVEAPQHAREAEPA